MNEEAIVMKYFNTTQRCFVKNCTSNTKDDVTLHRLPLNGNVRQEISRNLGLGSKFVVTSSHRVCSKHFTEDSFVAYGKICSWF